MTSTTARVFQVPSWQRLLIITVWLGAATLLLWVVLSIPLGELWRTLNRLSAWQIAVLLVVNALIFLLFGLRWWGLLKALGHRIPFSRLVLHRLAGFGLSYFTLGPQVGGEPVQLLLLHKKHGVPMSAAAASVGSDRLLEAIVNFSLLIVGLAITLGGRLAAAVPGPGLLVPVVVLLAPLALYVALLTTGRQLLTRAAGMLPRMWRLKKAIDTVEQQLVVLFSQSPGAVLFALAVSLISWAGMLVEYRLMLFFLGVPVSFVQLVSIMTFARLAFLLPAPGGLGALEAGQVFIFGALGLDPVQGLSASLLIRGRDSMFGLAGLWWAHLYGWKRKTNEGDDG